MPDQLTLRLPSKLSHAVAREAARRGISRSDIVRMALRQYLEQADASTERPFDRVKDLVGSARSGIPDLGTRHREHLLRKLRRGR